MIRALTFYLASSFSFPLLAVEPPTGFEAIFNGRDLTEWEGNPVHWSVDQGCIVGITDGSLRQNRFLTWQGGTVKNFELRVQVRISKGGNSGLQYRGRERPDLGEWILSGYQCDVLPAQQGLNGMFYEEQGRRILGRTGEQVVVDEVGIPWVVGEMEVKAFPAGEWRDYRVLVQGNHHQHWIDGHQTADAIDLDPAGRALEGLLGVQVHVGPAMRVEYRNFWLKHLPDDLPLQQPVIPSGAHLVRPQQSLPKGWTPPIRGKLVAHLADARVTWDQLTRRGFKGSASYDLASSPAATHLRVWIGGPRESLFTVRVDDQIVISQKRENPTWELLEVPLAGKNKVELLGEAEAIWAEPTLWEIETNKSKPQ